MAEGDGPKCKHTGGKQGDPLNFRPVSLKHVEQEQQTEAKEQEYDTELKNREYEC